jgi:hypothetical protein
VVTLPIPLETFTVNETKSSAHKVLKFCLFLSGYIHCMGVFIVTIPNRLILSIDQITPTVSPPLLLPTLLKAIARGFFVLVHRIIRRPFTIDPHINLLHSPSLLPQVPRDFLNVS